MLYVFYSDLYIIYKVLSRLRRWLRVPVPLRAFPKTSTNVPRDMQKNIQ